MIEQFLETDAVAGFLCVKPNVSYHFVQSNAEGQVTGIVSAQKAGLWTNGGFFVFRQAIFDYLHEGEELVEAPFQRLIEAGQALHLQARGVLGLHGHLQGEATTGRPGPGRLTTLATVGQPGSRPHVPHAFVRARVEVQDRCPCLMPLSLRSARSSAWVPTPTTSRSAAAARY